MLREELEDLLNTHEEGETDEETDALIAYLRECLKKYDKPKFTMRFD